MERCGRLTAALEDLRTHGYARLRPIAPKPIKGVSAFIAAHHLGDPVTGKDAWRPWARRQALRRDLEAAHFDPDQTGWAA